MPINTKQSWPIVARVNKYKIDANQELIAIGVSNIAGSFVSAYPVTGSFSRYFNDTSFIS